MLSSLGRKSSSMMILIASFVPIPKGRRVTELIVDFGKKTELHFLFHRLLPEDLYDFTPQPVNLFRQPLLIVSGLLHP